MKDFRLLLESGNTVFTNQEISLLFSVPNDVYLRKYLSYQKSRGYIVNPYPGVWCLPHYDRYECASKMQAKSYISLQTVLYDGGVIFQNYPDALFLVSSISKTKIADGFQCIYRRIKDEILLDPRGVTNKQNYQIASIERAFADYVYLIKTNYVDNPQALNPYLLEQLIDIYPPATRLLLQNTLDVIRSNSA